eukprot:3453843-Pyramimonas_sp.AAC.1
MGCCVCGYAATGLPSSSKAATRADTGTVPGLAGPALLVQRRLARKRPGVSGPLGLAPDAVGI